MADSGPSRRHGWILRVRVIPENGLDSFGDLLGTCFRTRFRKSADRPKGEISLFKERVEPGPRTGAAPANNEPTLRKIIIVGGGFL